MSKPPNSPATVSREEFKDAIHEIEKLIGEQKLALAKESARLEGVARTEGDNARNRAIGVLGLIAAFLGVGAFFFVRETVQSGLRGTSAEAAKKDAESQGAAAKVAREGAERHAETAKKTVAELEQSATKFRDNLNKQLVAATKTAREGAEGYATAAKKTVDRLEEDASKFRDFLNVERAALKQQNWTIWEAGTVLLPAVVEGKTRAERPVSTVSVKLPAPIPDGGIVFFSQQFAEAGENFTIHGLGSIATRVLEMNTAIRTTYPAFGWRRSSDGFVVIAPLFDESPQIQGDEKTASSVKRIVSAHSSAKVDWVILIPPAKSETKSPEERGTEELEERGTD